MCCLWVWQGAMFVFIIWLLLPEVVPALTDVNRHATLTEHTQTHLSWGLSPAGGALLPNLLTG